MATAIIFFQGLFEFVGTIGFISGYFFHIPWLMIACGLMVILDDIIEISMGILNPLVPVILAIVLAFFFTPWWVGIFWASSVFKILGIPTSLIKVIAPKKFLSKAMAKSGI